MNKKEISELSRRWKPGKCAVSRIYGCHVSGKRILTDLDEGLGTLTEKESEFYLGYLKKTLSGTLGKNLIDIVFSTAQVADSEEHRLLMKLRDTALQEGDTRRAFYQKVIDCLDMGEDDYLILMASDAYDVPRRGKDGAAQDSETVFNYFLCAVCPVKASKTSLDYFPGDNEFHCSDGHTAAPPELGFLFPTFDDRTANLYNALFYSRKPDQLHQEFIDGIFHTEPPLSAAEQRESFQAALIDALGEACDLQVLQAIHQQFADQIAQHKESKDPEPLSLTAGDVGHILRDCGVAEELAAGFEKQCAESMGEGTALNPVNLVDVGRFEIRSDAAKTVLDPESAHLVETRVIDGQRYLLVPVGEEIEVNGIPVRTTTDITSK